jgi:long-subunit acyl-CoA synthetase (AMP-forming)
MDMGGTGDIGMMSRDNEMRITGPGQGYHRPAEGGENADPLPIEMKMRARQELMRRRIQVFYAMDILQKMIPRMMYF